ncbi:hypothetical protein L6164_037205 [Bauhinia variegata]|uniref:Uncharacterized protein n=1 Tax=Bauhinia variegata TaxID=167791 RepID=A0ACB9KJI9_BAUVA|nr:hypothetical protein L6164_037205 [Bauhinia variegata]
MWDFTSVHSIITLTITIARLTSFAISLACTSSGKELEGYRKKLARAEAIFEASKTTAKPEGTRPTNKTGFRGLIGKKVDSIEYYSEKINETIPKLESEQKITLREKQQNAAVVFFNNRVTAASAAQSLHAQMVDHWTVIDAPERRQILWPNLKIKFFERQVRQYVPVVNIKALRTVLEAYLPQLALIIFLALLPKLLFFLSKLEVIVPLRIPFGIAYFGLAWLILQNQALKVYVPSYESYRRMWPHIHNRILASLILYQVTMVGYFIVQKFYYTPLLFPLPILSLLYGFVSAKKFYRAFRLPALEIAAYELKEFQTWN